MTGRHRHPGPVEPSDDRVVAALVGGVPDPAVDGVVDRLIGPADDAARRLHPAPEPDLPVRPGGIAARWGCSVVSHRQLGWCCNCPGVAPSAELSAWRIFAAGCDAPDLTWARAVTEQCQR